MGVGSAAALSLTVLLLAGVFATPSTPATGSLTGAATATGASSLSVTATGDYGYTPSTFQQVPTNSTITVTFTDGSVLAHTFTIIGREGWVIPSDISASAFSNLVFGDSPPVLFDLNVSGSGDQVTGSFQSPGPGWYEFVCTVPGHFQNGMYGFIAFGEDLPGNLTTPSSRQSVVGSITPVQGAEIGALFLVVVLAFVYWQRRRDQRRRASKPAGLPKDRGAQPPQSKNGAR